MKPLRIAHVGMYRDRGGAATAMTRVHHAIQKSSPKGDVRSQIVAASENAKPGGTENPEKFWSRASAAVTQADIRLRKSYGKRIAKATQSVVSIPPSKATGLGALLNSKPYDIINLHWLGANSLSLSEIRKINKPLVWRLADLWAIGAVEHYPDIPLVADCYKHNLNGLPLDVYFVLRQFWKKKSKALQFPFLAICPSNWTKQAAEASEIFRFAELHIIPNPLDTDFWSPAPPEQTRSARPENLRVLFGADGGTADPRKGWGLLRDALQYLVHTRPNVSLSVEIFGETRPKEKHGRLTISYLGFLTPDKLRSAYRRADVYVATPLSESFGQTVTEAQACGTAVIGTAIGGLLDTVRHLETGYLLRKRDPRELAQRLSELAGNRPLTARLGSKAREVAVETWSYSRVGAQYIEIYKSLTAANRGDRV